MCVLSWTVRYDFRANLKPQVSHSYGFYITMSLCMSFQTRGLGKNISRMLNIDTASLLCGVLFMCLLDMISKRTFYHMNYICRVYNLCEYVCVALKSHFGWTTFYRNYMWKVLMVIYTYKWSSDTEQLQMNQNWQLSLLNTEFIFELKLYGFARQIWKTLCIRRLNFQCSLKIVIIWSCSTQ